jgi:putative ABC transport system permease protein
MRSPRWNKLLRDLWMARGRTLMMIIAIAVSVFGVGTVLIAYTILTEEIERNYVQTNPASATIKVDEVSDEILDYVRSYPEVAEVEARKTVLSRIRTEDGDWLPLIVFAVTDFEQVQINTFAPEEGAWPGETETLLLERTSLDLVEGEIGDSFIVRTPNGENMEVPVSGTVHDPGLAPSWQERMLYAYVSPETLGWLGEPEEFDEVRIVLTDPYNREEIHRVSQEIAGQLTQQGHTVHELEIPPPGEHPHQRQMVSLLVMLLLFSFMALALSGILVATMISGMLAQQVRQIGMMKAIGARTNQIIGLYMLMVLIISLVATVLAIPFSIMAGRALAEVVADLLNFTIYSGSVPLWVFAVQVSGLLVTLLIAFFPIIRGSRITVREAINDYGVTEVKSNQNRLDVWLSKLKGLGRSLHMIIRNTFRRRGRLLLTLMLLSVGGAMFMTALNVLAAWEQNLDEAAADRHYDLEIRLHEPAMKDEALAIINSVPGVEHTEGWGYSSAAVTNFDGVEVIHTYPDGSHGSFAIRAMPVDSELISFPVVSGRWLQEGETAEVVLNHTAAELFSGASPGDEISLTVHDQPLALDVVGVMREVGSPAVAYVSMDKYEQIIGQEEAASSFRVVFHDQAERENADIIQSIEEQLDAANLNVDIVISEEELDQAINEHIAILIFALMAMAVLMAVVGGLGLASAISTSVVERTREFGIMQANGATPAIVLRNVISEGVLIGLMSWFLAALISLPLSSVVGNIVGGLAFNVSLPLVFSPYSALLWLALIVIGSSLASFFPARRASRLTIRETLEAI